MKAINQVPEDKAEAIYEFADFILKQYEDQLLTKGITNLNSNSKSFDFLNDEEEIYTLSDIKEEYNG